MGPKKRLAKVRLFVKGIPVQAVVDHYFPTGDYKKVLTSGATRYDGGGISLCFGSRWMGPGLMLLIGKVRAEVLKNYTDEKISPVLVSPEYFKLGEIKRKSAAVEVDISKAYLTAALKIGAISQFTHDKLLTCAKSTRLVVIGSLGTKRVVSEYFEGDEVHSEIEVNYNLKEVWGWIVAEVDKTMREVAASLGKGFMYYWCDAAFVKASHVAAAQQAMKDHGYESKSSMVTIRKDGKKVYILGGGKAPREFPVKHTATVLLHQNS